MAQIVGDILELEATRVNFLAGENEEARGATIITGGSAAVTGLGGGVTDTGITSEQNAGIANAQGAEEAFFTRLYFTIAEM
jgi:hypothetical protein